MTTIKLRYFLTLLVITTTGIYSGCTRQQQLQSGDNVELPKESTLARINREGVLRVGFGVWAPYTSLDLNEKEQQKQVKGFSVDLINEIASRTEPKLKVEFVQFNWATMKGDLDTKRFDLVIEPIFMTVPRAQTFGFSRPFSWFGVACAVVKKSETRFSKFSDLDRDDITISLAENWTSTEYAKANLSKPQFKMVVLRENNFAQLEDVLYERADAALQDAPTVIQFVAAHSDKVKALWLENPPSVVAGGFVTRMGDADLISFLNNSLYALEADGTMRLLDAKWKTLGLFEERPFRAGVGLRSQ